VKAEAENESAVPAATPGSSRARARRNRKWVVAIVLAQLALLALAELRLRALVPAYGVTPFRTSSIAGLSAELRPGFSTLYAGQQIAINSSGYRGPEFAAAEPDVLRVALVGDSMTFGFAVPYEDTLPPRLEQALRARGVRAQVLGLGVPGYSALDIARVVETRALELRPHVIVYVFFSNDIEPQAVRGSIPEDRVIDPLVDFRWRSALLEWSVGQARRLGWRLGFQLERYGREEYLAEYEAGGGERLRAALRRMQAVCDEHRIELRVAAYPAMSYTPLNGLRAIDERAAADVRALGIPHVDLIEAFADTQDLSRYQVSPFDAHPDGEAHRLVAEHLATWLRGTLGPGLIR
jgi:lysophospholipase L1-like esterase